MKQGSDSPCAHDTGSSDNFRWTMARADDRSWLVGDPTRYALRALLPNPLKIDSQGALKFLFHPTLSAHNELALLFLQVVRRIEAALLQTNRCTHHTT